MEFGLIKPGEKYDPFNPNHNMMACIRLYKQKIYEIERYWGKGVFSKNNLSALAVFNYNAGNAVFDDVDALIDCIGRRFDYQKDTYILKGHNRKKAVSPDLITKVIQRYFKRTKADKDQEEYAKMVRKSAEELSLASTLSDILKPVSPPAHLQARIIDPDYYCDDAQVEADRPARQALLDEKGERFDGVEIAGKNVNIVVERQLLAQITKYYSSYAGKDAMQKFIEDAIIYRADNYQELYSGLKEGKTFYIDLVDKSPSLFGNHKDDGYIYVNKIIFDKLAQNELPEFRSQAIYGMLAIGISHELRHEAGFDDEGRLTQEDVFMALKLFSINIGEADKFINSLNGLIAGDDFLNAVKDEKEFREEILSFTHDIVNPIITISGFSDFIMRDLPSDLSYYSHIFDELREFKQEFKKKIYDIKMAGLDKTLSAEKRRALMVVFAKYVMSLKARQCLDKAVYEDLLSKISDENLRDFLEAIIISTDNFFGIADSFIAAKGLPVLSDIDIGDFIEVELPGLANRIKLSHEKPQIEIDYKNEAPNNSFIISADRIKLLRIFENLLANAVDFMQNQGSITIGLRRFSQDYVEIYVKDTGPGINRKTFANINDIFKRGRSGRLTSELRKFGGTGIGLWGVKNMVKQQGGSISVESEEGTGTMFKVIVPIIKSGPNIRMPVISHKSKEVMQGASQSQI